MVRTKVDIKPVVVQDGAGSRVREQGRRHSHHEGARRHHQQLRDEGRGAFWDRREGGPCHAGGEFRAHEQNRQGSDDELRERDAGRGDSRRKVSALGREGRTCLGVVPGRLGKLSDAPRVQGGKAHHHQHGRSHQDQGGEERPELDELRVEDTQETGTGARALRPAGLKCCRAHCCPPVWVGAAAPVVMREWYSTSSLVSSM